MIQGVRNVFEIVDIDRDDAPEQQQKTGKEPPSGKIILIGRGLAGLPLQESLNLSLFK